MNIKALNIRSMVSICMCTFSESIRSKILYSAILFSIFIVAIASFFGKNSIGDSAIVVKDFGLMSISFFTVAFVIINGSLMVFKEISKKTIFNILSKPIGRATFILGKYFGILTTALCLQYSLAVLFCIYLYFYQGFIDTNICQGFLFISFELIILSGLVVFFSSIVVTPVLSGLFSFGIFLVGRSSEFLIKFAELTGNSASKVVYWLVPHLDTLYRANDIVYGRLSTNQEMLLSLIYATTYSIVCVILANAAFSKRQFL